jgi:hypothetical protein
VGYEIGKASGKAQIIVIPHLISHIPHLVRRTTYD